MLRKRRWFLATIAGSVALAQAPIYQDIHVEKKSGAFYGTAMVMVHGKRKRVAQRAFAAWPVMGGQNALVLVAAAGQDSRAEPHLRFYEGTTRKYRDLGGTVLDSATLIEHKLADGSWAFVLAGHSGSQPVVVVAGMHAVHGLIKGASDPEIRGDSLAYTLQGGPRKIVELEALLAEHTDAIYNTQMMGGHYVQFKRDGTAVFEDSLGAFHTAIWRTDGYSMTVTEQDGRQFFWPRKLLVPMDGIPAGTRLTVRLLEPLDSSTARTGEPVHAVLISPGTFRDRVLIPPGSEFEGKLTKAHGVGWAVGHETAALTAEFDSVKLPDGTTLAIHTRLYQVENSREEVKNGTVQGVRATGTLGYSAEGKIQSVAALDPISYLFTASAATAALGFAESEILYPAGTELLLEVTAPLITGKSFPRTVPEFPADASDQRRLTQMIRNLPFRTATKGSNRPSDLTNLVFLGPPEGLRRAFKAAGWIAVDTLTAGSTFMTMKTVGGNQIYNQAPMSTLLLDERPPVFTLTKTTNTFASRHHLRVFDPLTKYDGQTVLTSSSTQDIGIAFSQKQKTFIHVIDGYIDNERAKVVNDLEFTGCVEAMDLVPRPWVPQDAYNATGDKLQTDGAVAVMRISDCMQPRSTPGTPAEKPNRFKRITRDTVLAVRNDLYRGNVIYQGVAGVRWTRNYFATRDQLKPESGAWRTTDQSGTQFKGIGDVSPERQSAPAPVDQETASAKALEQAHRWDPPHYEIAIQGGYLRYPATRFETLGAFLVPNGDLDEPTWDSGFLDQIRGGWSAGVSLTLNSWRWVSSEFGYHYQRGKLLIGTYFADLGQENEEGTVPSISTSPVGLVTRQFEYNVLVHMRPREARWRPYVALGPALELISLADSPIKKAPAPFKLGLKNVGELLAAFESGSTPALDGGGIYELGLQYGAGVKFRVHPRITLSADFRETWAKNPSFLRSGYTASYFEMQDYTPRNLYTSSSGAAFRQQRFTLGLAFTF